ncbi:TerD family protein [Psychrobacter celer]|uniref:TerD family protein n=1 Tax=Psychrobacter celer TaxID=306572 RepID=UPI003FCF1F6E
MNLTVGQRAPLSNLAIEDTAPVRLKFTHHSPIEMHISCFALGAAGKLNNDDYKVFYNQPTYPCGQINLIHYESQPTASKGIQAEFEVCITRRK